MHQFDGIDALDTYASIKLGLRNRFQTKRGEKTVDLVDLKTRFNFFPGGDGLNRKRDDYIGLDLKIQLTDNISFLSERNEFNLGRGGVDILNTQLIYSTPKWNSSIGTRYVDNTNSTVLFSSTIALNEKWSVSVTQQYAFRTEKEDAIGRGNDFSNKSLYSAASITRYFHDWIARMSVSQIGTRDNDNIVSFDITPRGIGATTNRLRSLGALVPEQEQ